MKDTKTDIQKTALRLFNQKGTSAVSTNHIAEALGISPGNLYYHFRNKEEIIRSIMMQSVEEMGELWTSDEQPTLGQYLEILNTPLLWKYRFFQRELVSLMQADPALKRWYRDLRKARWTQIGIYFQHLIDNGTLVEPDDPSVMPSIIKISWLISDYWFHFLDVDGKPVNKASAKELVQMILLILRPYLSKDALEELSG
jgi:AcrR family transcriptional regulator